MCTVKNTVQFQNCVKSHVCNYFAFYERPFIALCQECDTRLIEGCTLLELKMKMKRQIAVIISDARNYCHYNLYSVTVYSVKEQNGNRIIKLTY